MGLRLAAAHRDVRRRPGVIRSLLGRRPESLRRRLPDEHRLDPRRPAVAGRVGQLRPGHREREPARLRRDAGQRRRRSINGPRNWGAGFMPAVYQGTRFASGREPIPNLATPEGRRPTTGSGSKLDLLDRAEPPARRRAARADRARSPHRQLRAGLPHAGRGARSGRPVAGNGRDAGALRPGRQGDRDLRPHVPARPAAGRARRALRAALSRRRQQVGRPHRASRRTTRELCRADRSADRRPAQGPEARAACSTTRW